MKVLSARGVSVGFKSLRALDDVSLFVGRNVDVDRPQPQYERVRRILWFSEEEANLCANGLWSTERLQVQLGDDIGAWRELPR